MKKIIVLISFLLILSFVSCKNRQVVFILATPPIQIARRAALPTVYPSVTPTIRPTNPPLPTATPKPTLMPTATATIRPTVTPTPTPIPLCHGRLFTDDLLTLVTRDYPLNKDFIPTDLERIDQYFPNSITFGYETKVRAIILPSLKQLIKDMQTAGLHPTIISGYRSYLHQTGTWERWKKIIPDRVRGLSATPGTSEHQLGTTIDFGSPEINNRFIPQFATTSEGAWLLANAHRYGFTMSYPEDAFEITQFYYEPWHYRYVGEALATELKEKGMSLTQYQLETRPIPCYEPTATPTP